MPQAAGTAFDAVRFGFSISPEENTIAGVRWAEPRKIRRVMVQFPDGAKMASPGQCGARLQYWHKGWNGRPEPVRAEAGAGAVGWAHMDDWTNGQWKDADTNVKVEGNTWTFMFNPTGEKEFKDLGHPGVGYRKTLKVRLVSDKAVPEPRQFQALTDATLQPLTVRVNFGKPALPGIAPGQLVNGHIEISNGSLDDSGADGEDGAVREELSSTDRASRSGAAGLVFNLQLIEDSDRHKRTFFLTNQDNPILKIDLLMAVDPVDGLYDRTVVTVRSEDRPFSFAADDVARGERILIDDLGILVTRGDDEITLAEYREARKEFAGKTVYDRVFDEPEQTWHRAWSEMPLKHPLYFVHGLPGNRNAMHQLPDGSVRITSMDHWFNLPPSDKDTKRKGWPGGMLNLGFGLPHGGYEATRDLKDGYLPELRTWWQDGPIHYEQTTILDKLDGGLTQIALDDPTVLLMHIRMVNTSDAEDGDARLLLSSAPSGIEGHEKLQIDGDSVYAVANGNRQFRYLLGISGVPFETMDDYGNRLISPFPFPDTREQGTMREEGRHLRWSAPLAPRQAVDVYMMIPSITLTEKAEIDALRRREFPTASQRICDFWRELTARSTQITTPEPVINEFYRAHLRHLMINCYKEIGSDRLHAHVGTFHYGVYPDESCMMISDLDRRGYHDEARRNLDSFLHYQGTVQMPGNFKSTEGLFYGSGGHDSGGYNKSHGWVMWNMAEHWKNTRDREWMATAAQKLVASCDWVTRERRATMTANPDGTRPIEYGWLPSGSLEDVTDYWYWMVTNACTVWGFDALAAALADFGHPEADRLQKDAKAYHDDFMTAMTEARIRAPVVRLRDNTYVPKYPSRLYERGRCHGWLRETLEGSIHLLITGLIEPDSPEAKWILQDFEDNLYISNEYGYAIPTFDRFWFSRGGFSMQANLLGGPLPYLYRDEIKHYVRAYFNPLASALYPETRMCNEHSLPELGYPAGDHFKSSDEAQSTYWLRLMFVNERGNNLYLGQAIPRYWLANGKTIGIERAATHFGPMSLQMTSQADDGRITALLTPPARNRPDNIYLRFRHPQAKLIQRITVNGQPHDQFDTKKEWVVLTGTVEDQQQIIAHY